MNHSGGACRLLGRITATVAQQKNQQHRHFDSFLENNWERMWKISGFNNYIFTSCFLVTRAVTTL